MVALGSQIWHFAVALSFLSGSAPVVTTVKDPGGQRVRAVPIITRLPKSAHQDKKPLVVDTKRLEKADPLHGIANSMGSMRVAEASSATKSSEAKDASNSVGSMRVVEALSAVKSAEAKDTEAEVKRGTAELKDATNDGTYRCVTTFAYPGNKEDVPFCALLSLPGDRVGYYVTYNRYARVIDGERVTEIAASSDYPKGSCFLPMAVMLDEKRLVVVSHLCQMLGCDQQMCLFDLSSGREIAEFQDKVGVLASRSRFGDCSYQTTHWSTQLERICALTVCPNGTIITGSPLGTIKAWDTKKPYACTKTLAPYVEIAYSSSLIGREPCEELLCSLSALSDTDVVYGLYDGTVKTLHLEDNTREVLGERHAKPVTAVVAIDNKSFASGSADGVIKIWRRDKRNRFVCLQTLQEHAKGIISLVVNNHYELISLSQDGEMRLWRR